MQTEETKISTEEVLGRSKHVFIKTYGCQMNVYDSELIAKIVGKLGYALTDNIEVADLVILNTCHIREKAAEKVYSELGKIKILEKKQNKKIFTIVAGCVAQAEGGEIFKRAHNVDAVVGPQSIHSLPELIAKSERRLNNGLKLEFDPVKKFDFLKEEIGNHKKDLVGKFRPSEFLSIQEGCDKFCTFCVVPYTRGGEFSRSVTDILQEAEFLVKGGAREITLLGQNVNAYHGLDGKTEVSLGALMKILSEIPGLKRLRYTTSHPADMHTELYEAHEIENVMPHLHLPIQSGSNKVLKAMNRKYTTEKYLEIIERLKAARAEIAFSSDFIVGFPTETEDDFEQTLDLVRKIGYAQSFSFKYSPRPGTPGAEYKQISEDVKSKRLQKLQDLLKMQQLEFNNACIGKMMPVLFEFANKKNCQMFGRTKYLQAVYLDEIKEELVGEIVAIRIKDANQNSLFEKLE